MKKLAAVCFLSLLGCREDAGEPDYSGLAAVFDRASERSGGEQVEGPDPYVPGENRLSLGMFYEGGYSHIISIDGVQANYFIFLAGDDLTLEQKSDPDRVEGQQSDRLTLLGTSFWGSGVIWDPPVDLGNWSRLALSLKSNDIEEVNIIIGTAAFEVALAAADYGYTHDGEWHSLVIPLSDFTDLGVELSSIRVAFAIGAEGGNSGAKILVDNVYME